MKIFEEKNLKDFGFWGTAAKQHAEELSYDQFAQVDAILDDLYPDGIEDVVLNDLFAYYFDTVRDWLGMPEDEDVCSIPAVPAA